MEKQQGSKWGIAVAIVLTVILVSAISQVVTGTGAGRRHESHDACMAEQRQMLAAERERCNRNTYDTECERRAFSRYEAGGRHCRLSSPGGAAGAQD